LVTYSFETATAIQPVK